MRALKNRALKTLTMMALLTGFAVGQSAGAGGTVPFLSSLDLTSAATGAMTSIGVSEMDAGKLAISNFISAAALDANDSIKVEVKVGSWSLPAGHDGNKTSVTANSDFKLKFLGVAAADEVGLQGSFVGPAFVELTSTDAVALRALDALGVSGDFTCDAEIDLDWNNDILGVYSVTVTYTITQQ